jgi:hypothetical protein
MRGETMSGTKISKLVLGSVLFLILGTLLISTISRGDLIGLAAEGVVTPAPSPTPTLSLAWQNATLDQIHFGEPKVVLTDTLGLRIVGWISDTEVLIRRDRGNGSAIELFNVETQTVRRLAKGRIWGRPIWSSQEEAVAYLLYDEGRKMTSLVWQTLDGQPVRVLEGAVQPIVLSPDGRGAMAYSTTTEDLRGKAFALQAGEDIRVDFARFAPPARNLGCGWKYDTVISPGGKWQVVYNCEHFLLVNSERGTIRKIDLGTEVIEGRFPRWALDAQWSQDGQQLAVVYTFGDSLPRITGLLILDPWEERVRKIERPPGLLFSEVDWAPEGRHLLVSGLEVRGEGTFLPRMWLVDVKTGRIRDLDLFPVARSEDPRGGAAWSPEGKYLLFYCRPKSVSGAALCLASAEVER